MEEKLRSALASLDKLPPPIEAACQNKVGLEPSRAPEKPVSTIGGVVTVSAVRLASESGIAPDARVVKKRRGDAGEAVAEVVGVVRSVGDDGVGVDWGVGVGVVTEPLASLVLAPNVKKGKEAMASSQVLDKPGVKWSPAGTEMNNAMLQMMAQVGLYQAYLTSGAGGNDLHIVPGGKKLPGRPVRPARLQAWVSAALALQSVVGQRRSRTPGKRGPARAHHQAGWGDGGALFVLGETARGAEALGGGPGSSGVHRALFRVGFASRRGDTPGHER